MKTFTQKCYCSYAVHEQHSLHYTMHVHCILKSVSHGHCYNNITDVAQEMMLHMQHTLLRKLKLTMSPALTLYFSEQYQ